MLQKIKLINFMSHKNTEFSVDEERSILITGDNGSGKSSLVEAIPYALFGRGRTTAGNLIRKTANQMSVSLVFDDVTISRGLSKGKGFTFFEITKSGAYEIYKGNLAQDKIIEYMGNDVDSFMLTCFFGFGEADSLLSVTSSVRMKTFEKITGIDIYNKFYELAKERLEHLEQKLFTIKEEEKLISSYTQQDADRVYKAILIKQEKEVFKKEIIVLLNKEVKDIEGKLKKASEKAVESTVPLSCNSEFQELCVRLALIQKDYDKLVISLNTEPPPYIEGTVEEYTEILKRQYDERDKIKLKLDLITDILENNDIFIENNCPLCSNKLSKYSVQQWKDDVNSYSENLNVYKQDISITEKKLNALIEYAEDLKLRTEQSNALSKLEKIRYSLAEKKVALEQASSVHTVNKLYNEVNDLQEKYKLILQTVAKEQTDLTVLGIEIYRNLDEYNQYLKQLKKKTELQEKHKTLKEKQVALEYVLKSFAPTGIPLELIYEFSNSLSTRATSVFNEFSEGEIVVENVQEGRSQGVEIKLMKDGSVRKYKELSEGQKVMVYLAVRLALTGVLYNKIPPFIVLDEISGHLSEESMEKLFRTIHGLIGNMYKQVFLVSHTNQRDIFDKKIHCALDYKGVTTIS